MNPWDIIYALSKTQSRNEKIEILKKVHADSEFWPGCKLALDELITFGVNKLPDPEKHGIGGKFSTFVKMTDALSKREVTGNKARDVIKAFAESCTENQWKYWYSRILEKKLNCGAEKIIVDISPEEHKARPFPFQGAIKITNVKTEDLPEQAYLEAKYDGERSFWFIKKASPEENTEDSIFLDVDDEDPAFNYDVKVYSRSGKEYFNFGDICSQLGILTKIPGFPDEGIVIDGEVVSESFTDLTSQARRKKDVDFRGNLKAFDVIAMDDFLSRKKTGPLKSRRAILENLISFLHENLTIEPRVHLSKIMKDVNVKTDMDVVMDFYQGQVDSGYEGIIVKDANSSYNYTKDKTWLKIKPSDTWDLTIVGTFEGKGKYEGMLGGFICSGVDHGVEINVEVGSGLTDDQRKEFWEIKEELIGVTAEIEADCVSKNKDGGHSLRFPRFKRLRYDK